MTESKQKVQSQTDAKKGITLDEWFMQSVDFATNISENYYGKDKISPAEITISSDYFPYISDSDIPEDYISRVNGRGILQATYWGIDHAKRGSIYVQYFQDVFFRSMMEIEDDKELSKAKKIFQIATSDKKYLIDAHKLLNAAVPDADLFMWAEGDLKTLHITDLNQELDFKRELKKRNLV